MRQRLTIVVLATLAIIAWSNAIADDTNSMVIAQAGSTGGSIGKQNKSVSGDEDRPATQPQRKEPSPTQSRETAKRSTAAALSGTWRVSQICNHGKFEIELDIKQTSATEFSGSSRGLTTGANSQIVGGKIDGNRVSFQRRAAGLSDRWSAQIERPGHMVGTSAGPVWRCSYTATRQ
ncbi:MAG: hypothetical protein HY659_12560 [Rhizobiales bacterium]|nr:hypothetical protein [Hyphomicrobiales bacterium]